MRAWMYEHGWDGSDDARRDRRIYCFGIITGGSLAMFVVGLIGLLS